MRKEYILKNNQQAVAILKASNRYRDFYRINLYCKINGLVTKVAYVNFKVENRSHYHNYKTLYIYKISATKRDFVGIGAGKALLDFVEEFAKENRARAITGKFYPEAPATCEETAKFYTRNNFTIDREDSWELYKSV